MGLKGCLPRVGNVKLIFNSAVLLILVGAQVIMPGWASAQPRVLTLPEALAIALEKNKDILKAREYRNLVAGRYVEERAAALPQVSLNSSIFRSRDESQRAFGNFFPLEQEVRTSDLSLSQVLFTFGQVGAAIRGAKIGVESAEVQLRLFRQAALLNVSTTFYDCLLAGELLELARQNREQKIRHQEEVRHKLKLGVATDYDVLAAEVAVKNAFPEVTRMENLQRTARERIRFLLGIGDTELDVQGKLDQEIAPYPPLDEALAKSRRKRPDLADLGYQIKIAEELVTIAGAGNKPRLDLKADWGWSDLQVEGGRADGPAWMAGLFLTYPIFDGLRTKGKVAQARSNLATLKLEEAKLLDGILLQTREAVDNLREAGEIVKALSATVEQADRLLLLAEKGYEFGVKTKLEVDDAALNRLQARGNLARARRDYLAAQAALEWVTGTIGE